MDARISIGQVKMNISELVNRVAYRGERIVLTSRKKPKAVLVSLEDYQKLLDAEQASVSIHTWRSDAWMLAQRIRERREGYDIDVDDLIGIEFIR